MTAINTKDRILSAALSLFSEKGYEASSMGEIAGAVGIKAPSLYNHYKSKRDIFNAILEKMQENYVRQASALNIDGMQADSDAEFFGNCSEETLIQTGKGLFMFFLHDEWTAAFRRMLTVEQFKSGEIARIYSEQYFNGPIDYQAQMFQMLTEGGVLNCGDPKIAAVQFYSPIYMLLELCDREPKREAEALELIEQHIRQFNKLYGKGLEK